jgi:hypothetical protein
VSGTCIVNSLGAAASITRSHLHLLGDRLPFLGALPRGPVVPDAVGLAGDLLDCRLWQLQSPVPVVAVGVEGPAADRARIVHRLLECRTTSPFNLVGTDGIAWLFLRLLEIPTPHFPRALGGAELWGRWCFEDPRDMELATAAGLEQAVRLAGVVL